MLKLTPDLHAEIRAHGAATYPHEGCGLLLGEARDGANVILAARPLPNVWPVESEKPERFRIDPADWRDVEPVSYTHLKPVSNSLSEIYPICGSFLC